MNQILERLFDFKKKMSSPHTCKNRFQCTIDLNVKGKGVNHLEEA